MNDDDPEDPDGPPFEEETVEAPVEELEPEAAPRRPAPVRRGVVKTSSQSAMLSYVAAGRAPPLPPSPDVFPKNRAAPMTKEQAVKATVRVEAALYYMTHPEVGTDALSVMFGVPVGTLARWAKKDDWQGKREAWIAKWAVQAAQRLGSRYSKELEGRKTTLENLRERAVGFLDLPEVRPKSFETLAATILNVTGEIVETERLLTGELRPPGAEAPEAAKGLTGRGSSISPDEARAAARAVLLARQAKALPAPVEASGVVVDVSAAPAAVPVPVARASDYVPSVEPLEAPSENEA